MWAQAAVAGSAPGLFGEVSNRRRSGPSQGKSLAAIANGLNADRIPTAQGGLRCTRRPSATRSTEQADAFALSRTAGRATRVGSPLAEHRSSLSENVVKVGHSLLSPLSPLSQASARTDPTKSLTTEESAARIQAVIAPGVDFDALSSAHLKALVESGLTERRTVEYKRELPGLGDDARREFLAQVTSFANSGGGDLLYGIRAEAGVPKEIVPITLEPDATRLQWESVIRDGVQPRIPGVRVREIPVGKGYVLLFRIPRSWSAPHAVVLKGRGSFRFHARTSAGKYDLDITELRDAFLASSALGDRIRNFRTERLGRIVANEAPVPLPHMPTLVAHVIPYRGLTGQSSIELNAAGGSGLFRPGFGDLTNDGERWNIDGLLSFSSGSDDQSFAGYAQIFRDGTFELVDAYSLQDRPVEGYVSPWTSGHLLERMIVLGLANPIAVMQRLGLEGPAAVLMTLLGVKGYGLVTGDVMADSSGWHRFDRDTVLLPDVVIEDVAAIVDFRGTIPRLLRPVADATWQAAGWLRSPNFHASGQWSPPT
jgi:hypothetical protein